LDLTGNFQLVRIAYLSAPLKSLVIDYSAIEYRVGFEPRMGATVRGRSVPRRPWGLPAFHHFCGYPRLPPFIRT